MTYNRFTEVSIIARLGGMLAIEQKPTKAHASPN
jgi:hypothetical protein